MQSQSALPEWPSAHLGQFLFPLDLRFVEETISHLDRDGLAHWHDWFPYQRSRSEVLPWDTYRAASGSWSHEAPPTGALGALQLLCSTSDSTMYEAYESCIVLVLVPVLGLHYLVRHQGPSCSVDHHPFSCATLLTGSVGYGSEWEDAA